VRAAARIWLLKVLIDNVLAGHHPQLLPAVATAFAGIAVLEARRGRRAQHDVRERASELTSAAEEGLSAIALVKAFARGGHEQRRFAAAARRAAAARLRMVRVRATFGPLAKLTAGIGTAAVAWAGASQVLAGRLSLGSLVVFLSYLASLYTPIQSLSRVAGSLQRAMVGAERVTDILDVPAGLKDRLGGRLPPVTGRVAFRHVTFSYGPGRPALRDVSFTIAPGEVVALIGPSGAGKTTVVSLLLSYYDPGQGTVTSAGISCGTSARPAAAGRSLRSCRNRCCSTPPSPRTSATAA
jgi:subfamily B ATP-binding cassette protein MsbA